MIKGTSRRLKWIHSYLVNALFFYNNIKINTISLDSTINHSNAKENET